MPDRPLRVLIGCETSGIAPRSPSAPSGKCWPCKGLGPGNRLKWRQGMTFPPPPMARTYDAPRGWLSWESQPQT